MGERTAHFDLPLGPQAPAAARHAVTAVPGGWGFSDRTWLHDAAVVVSELVSNAVRHGGDRGHRLFRSCRAAKAATRTALRGVCGHADRVRSFPSSRDGGVQVAPAAFGCGVTYVVQGFAELIARGAFGGLRLAVSLDQCSHVGPGGVLASGVDADSEHGLGGPHADGVGERPDVGDDGLV